MSTQEQPYGTTADRLKTYALNAEARDRLAALAARYWEIAAYVAIAACAAGLRFWDLGARAYHHDESLHGYFSFGFTKGLREFFTVNSPNVDTYKHVPFMHGPFQFIGNGFIMWVFGDGDYQGRILAATLGTLMVAMPFLFRKQLGTIGALATSLLIAFSPMLLYYSRFTREDIYEAFWTFGIVIFMWRYLTSREDRFLFLTAGFMAGAFSTKETTWMTVAAFIGFVDFMLAVRIADGMRAKTPVTDVAYAVRVVALLPVAWAIALAWPFIEEWRARYGLDEMPAEGNLLIVMGTLAVPQYAAGIQFLPGFGDAWKNRAGDNSPSHVASQEFSVAVTTVILLIGVSSALGLTWRPKTWLFAAASFWVPYVLLYTTFFSNPPGFMSGIWGSMDYWISQQSVARGSQPGYYYFITIPVYEFLPLILSIAGALYYFIRGRRDHALMVAGGFVAIIVLMLLPPGPKFMKAPLFHVWAPFGVVLLGVFTLRMDMFTRFLLFWAVSTSLFLTVASEKMPWLSVHIALPLAILAGRFVGDVLSNSDLRDDLPKIERFAPYAYAVVAATLSVFVFVIVGPFSLAAAGAWILAVVAAVAFVWAFTSYSPRTGVQVAVVGIIAALAVFTLRAGVLASLNQSNVPETEAAYSPGLSHDDHGALPVEVLVYTQTSGDIPILRDKLAQYAKQTGLGLNQPVVVDSVDGFTWPWAWYLRNYKDVAYTSITSGYQPKQGAVLFIARQDVASLNLGGQYSEGIPYHHRRWFPEEYRQESRSENGYTSHEFFRDLFSKHAWSTWRDYWIRRAPPAEIGTVDAVAFFPKDFVGVPTQPAGPTVRTEGTQLVIGGFGSAPGQLNAPSEIRLDAVGNLYVADTNNNRIEKYDPQGGYLSSAGGFGAGGVTLNQPWSMAVAPDGSVFVADTWNHKIVKLDKDLKKGKDWGSGGQTAPGGDPFKLFGPRDIAITPDGNVLITDTGNARVIEYTQNGDFVKQWGGKARPGDSSPAPLEFNEPVGLAVALNGDVYVADYWNKRITHFDKDFNPKAESKVPTWGSNAVTDRPYIALLLDGHLLATDPANGKVLIFGAVGAQLGAYDLPKVAGQAVARPIGVATDGASVLVADSAGSVVRKIPIAEVVK